MLQFTDLNVSFAQGVDTKSDPKQLPAGQLTSLVNASFQSPKQIKKRDGFTSLPSSATSGSVISSFQNELVTADSTSLYSYSPETNGQILKGSFTPLSLGVQAIVRNAGNQGAPDSALNVATGLECFVWINTDLTGQTQLMYSVLDTQTGVTVVNQSVVTGAVTTYAKVLSLGTKFFIIYRDTTLTNLVLRLIDTATPSTLGAVVTVSTATTNAIFDVIVASSKIYIAYAASTSCGFRTISSAGVVSSQYLSTEPAEVINGCLALAADASGNIWCAYGTLAVPGDVRLFVVNGALTAAVLTRKTIEASINASNITLLISGTTASVYYEAISGSTVSDYVRMNTCTLTGTLSTASDVMRGVGLAAKAFSYAGVNYLLVIYAGQFVLDSISSSHATSGQPTYFLVAHTSGLAKVVGKLAPSLAYNNYYTLSLPQITQSSAQIFTLPYLVKENLSSVSNGVVTFKIGLQKAQFDFGARTSKMNFAQNLHLTGAQLWSYDGSSVVEHGFHLAPENLQLSASVSPNPSLTGGGIGLGALTTAGQLQYMAVYEWIDNQGQLHQSAPSEALTIKIPPIQTPFTFTANLGVNSAGTAQIFNVSNADVAKLYVGQVVTDTTTPANILGGTTITRIDSTNAPNNAVFLSQSTFAFATGDTFSTKDIRAITLDLPTLHASNKSNVTIAIYRTTVNGTIFYRTGQSVTYNDPTVDSVTFVDKTPDAAILGNQTLYTTGGEVDNFNAPAVSAVTTFKNRLVYLSPENPLAWGYSKQVIPGYPVEFSALLFTENVDASIGKITAIGSLDDKLILFGPLSKFFVVGSGPAPSGVNNDFSDASRIIGSTGCTNQKSVLEIPLGLIYQDPTKGIWLLDRSFGEQYIGAAVEAYNSNVVTSSSLVPGKTQARFTLDTGTVLVLDYTTGQWETDIYAQAAIDSTIFQNKLCYITAAGSSFVQTPGVYTDNGAVIPMTLKTGWLNFGGVQNFMRVREMMILGTYKSPHTLTVKIYTDYGPSAVQTITIPVLTDPGQYEYKIAMKVQKCTAMQIEIIESQTSGFSEGLSLSGIAFRVGLKSGLNNLKSGAAY